MTTFSELALSPSLKERLTAASFVTPTPVQASAIPHALEGQDVIATAQTGTGKTLAFLIPIVEKLAAQKATGVSALILVPTRELAMQVVAQYDVLRSKQAPPAALVVGGLAEGKQLDALRRGARLVVATPGRLEDFLDRRLVSLSNVQTLVLDEADRMLDMGFLPSIRRIASLLPATRQTLCFSATMGAAIAQLVKDYTRNPVRLSFGSTLKPSESVRLQAFEVNDGEKADVLFQLLTSEKGRCLVFSRTKRGTDRIARVLNRQGIQAAVIHGDRSQSQRTAALTGFQRGQYRVLVATDVAARGIHVQDIAHVINYDLPDEAENFVHRVGRTGRAGESGVASTLFLRDQRTELFQLERTLGIRIERVPANLGSPAAPRAVDSSHSQDATRTHDSNRAHGLSRSNDSARSHGSARSHEKSPRHASSFSYEKATGHASSHAELRAPSSGSRSDGRMARLPGEFLQVQVG